MLPSSLLTLTYKLVRPLIYCMDAENAHHASITVLKSGLFGIRKAYDDSVLHTKVAGLDFKNPIGLAAGFDKQAEAIKAIFALNFGAVEVGSITPKPQPGNPRPRLFRDEKAKAVLNRFGFNSDGIDVCRARIEAYRSTAKAGGRGILGINVGKNKETEDAAADYVQGINAFAPLADYLTINISSPNTAGLRDLQRREPLLDLMKRCIEARDRAAQKPPVFVKIAPDLTPEQLDDVAEVCLATKVDGVIVTNTTLARPAGTNPAWANEAGGLSGKPLFEPSTKILMDFYARTKGAIPLIGCGGISNGQDAYRKIRAGASLVQIYSAMVFEGPALADSIARELATLLRNDGYRNVAEAVGVDAHL